MKIYFVSPGSTPDQLHSIVASLSGLKARAIYTSPTESCLSTASSIGQALLLHPNQKTELSEIALDEVSESVVMRLAEFVGTLKLLSQKSVHIIVCESAPLDLYLSHVLKRDVRPMPQGGVVTLEYSKNSLPVYKELI